MIKGGAAISLPNHLTEKRWHRTMTSESVELFSLTLNLAFTLALAIWAVKPGTPALAYHADRRAAGNTCASLAPINLQALHKITNFTARLNMVSKAGTASGDRLC